MKRNGVIYMYTSPSNKSYVGQTWNERDRKRQHARDAANNRDKCAIHCAMRVYGFENFKYRILHCNIQTQEELNRLEQFEIVNQNTLKPYGYNLTTGGSNGMASEELRQKLRDGRPRKPVICLETKVAYDSPQDAGEVLGIDFRDITRCARGALKMIAGFHWRYYNKDVPLVITPKMLEPSGLYRPVYCVETQKIYNTATEAAKDVNGNASSISNTCKNWHETSSDLHWRYYKVGEPLLTMDDMPVKKYPKPVQCIETGCIYKNAKQAFRETGIEHTSILDCCNGGANTSGGFHWRYYSKTEPLPDILALSPRFNSYPVYCVETGVIYPSSMEAARQTGGNCSSIASCCRGRYLSYHGVHWQYYKHGESFVSVTDLPKKGDSISKSVFCPELGETYRSVTEASKKNNISTATICRCCKSHRATSKGLHWEYKEEK